LEAREKELRKMTQSQKGVPGGGDVNEGDIRYPENMIAQSTDPKAQES